MTIQAYINKHSFNVNEKIDIFIKHKGKVNIQIFPLFEPDDIIFKQRVRVNFKKDNPLLCFAEGCDWTKTCEINLSELKITENIYIISISNADHTFYIPFFILNEEITVEKNLVIVNTNTWHAYNKYGGGNFYRIEENLKNNIYVNKNEEFPFKKLILDTNSSAIVSTQRPLLTISNDIKNIFGNKKIDLSSHLFHGEYFLWKWLRDNHIKYDVICDPDVENKKYFNNIKIVFLNCHPEYWSHKMYYNLLKKSHNFNLIYLGGNGIWRKVYINYEKNRIEKMGYEYKGKILNNFKNSFSIDKFAENNKIKYPPYCLLGLFYDGRGQPEYKEFKCLDNNSFIFENTDINKGDIIGNSIKCSGNETDKVFHIHMEKKHEEIFKNTQILAKGLNKDNGGGEIVLHKFRKCNVFSCGSIPFTQCIFDKNVTQMVLNVYKKFSE